MREKNAYAALQASKGENPVQVTQKIEKSEKAENRISVNVRSLFCCSFVNKISLGVRN